MYKLPYIKYNTFLIPYITLYHIHLLNAIRYTNTLKLQLSFEYIYIYISNSEKIEV